MAIFSDRNLDSDDPFILKDASTVTPASNPSNSVKSPSSNVSINDLISSLYSQAEQNVSVDHIPKASDNGMHSPTTVFKSDSVNIDDDFDEDSWDFKAADSSTRADDQSSDIDLGDSQKKLSTTLELNDCVDFYCKLKDELCSVVLCHLDNLKVGKVVKIIFFFFFFLNVKVAYLIEFVENAIVRELKVLLLFLVKRQKQNLLMRKSRLVTVLGHVFYAIPYYFHNLSGFRL
jgi:hypothetical protein